MGIEHVLHSGISHFGTYPFVHGISEWASWVLSLACWCHA